MSINHIKLPRLYVDQELKENGSVSFGADQAHYLRNVMRRKAGDLLRLFNGRDGEWIVSLTEFEKRSAGATVQEQLYAQPDIMREVHLIFTPVKKARMDFLVEKAVELGVTHFHPVLTQNTENRKINGARIQQQIIEAAEQCERLDVPVCAPLEKLEHILGSWPEAIDIYACIERSDAPLLSEVVKGKAIAMAALIGPEGGFTAEEKDMLIQHAGIIKVSLGEQVLRSETAALFALSTIKNT